MEKKPRKKIYGVGVTSKGKYKTTCSGKHGKIYKMWRGILRRCYCEKFQQTSVSYKGCTISEEWYDFQNFASWCEDNYVEGYQIDKDILLKGNKVYSPETCCFVPHEINSMFTNKKRKRGACLIGVVKRKNVYEANFSVKKKAIYLGTFLTEKEAFLAYKEAKEKHIKNIAEKWRGQITKKVYQALVNYKVEITD